MKIEVSKSGLPCVWECGGSNTNTGDATIISDYLGNPKKAIYIPTGGSLACGCHALIPIVIGDYVISVDHHRGDFTGTISRIISIDTTTAEVEVVNTFSQGQWDKEVDEKFVSGYESACQKALDYHCRRAYFVA